MSQTVTVELTWEDAHRLYAGMNVLLRFYDSGGFDRNSQMHRESMEHTHQLRARMWQAMQDAPASDDEEPA